MEDSLMHGLRIAGILLLIFGVFGGWPTGSDGITGALEAGSVSYLVITGGLAAAGLYALIASFLGGRGGNGS